MHHSAMLNGKSFFETYSKILNRRSSCSVIEIGSQNVNGTLRDVCPKSYKYVGLDFVAGAGVDVVMSDPYRIPIDSDSVDVVVTSSCFEHSEFFWLSFLEIIRILKPNGLLYLNAPTTGSFHRFPVDCWRFYPDSGSALVRWAERNDYKPALLESFVQVGGEFQDFVGVFLKDVGLISEFPTEVRMTHGRSDIENVSLYGIPVMQRVCLMSQNDRKLNAISAIVGGQLLVGTR